MKENKIIINYGNCCKGIIYERGDLIERNLAGRVFVVDEVVGEVCLELYF